MKIIVTIYPLVVFDVSLLYGSFLSGLTKGVPIKGRSDC